MSYSANYPNQLAAGVTTDAGFVPFELWAGESDLVTSQGTTGATDLTQFQVIARLNGLIVPWNPAASDSSKQAIGFMAQASVASGPAAYFTGGVPNHAALVWPAGVTALNDRKAAFDGTNITIGSLL